MYLGLLIALQVLQGVAKAGESAFDPSYAEPQDIACALQQKYWEALPDMTGDDPLAAAICKVKNPRSDVCVPPGITLDASSCRWQTSPSTVGSQPYPHQWSDTRHEYGNAVIVVRDQRLYVKVKVKYIQNHGVSLGASDAPLYALIGEAPGQPDGPYRGNEDD